jgi:hypothetical protein
MKLFSFVYEIKKLNSYQITINNRDKLVCDWCAREFDGSGIQTGGWSPKAYCSKKCYTEAGN